MYGYSQGVGLCLPAGCWLSAVGVVAVVAGCVRVLVVLLAGALLRLGSTSRAGGASVLSSLLACVPAVLCGCCRSVAGASVLAAGWLPLSLLFSEERRVKRKQSYIIIHN